MSLLYRSHASSSLPLGRDAPVAAFKHTHWRTDCREGGRARLCVLLRRRSSSRPGHPRFRQPQRNDCSCRTMCPHCHVSSSPTSHPCYPGGTREGLVETGDRTFRVQDAGGRTWYKLSLTQAPFPRAVWGGGKWVYEVYYSLVVVGKYLLLHSPVSPCRRQRRAGSRW